MHPLQTRFVDLADLEPGDLILRIGDYRCTPPLTATTALGMTPDGTLAVMVTGTDSTTPQPLTDAECSNVFLTIARAAADPTAP